MQINKITKRILQDYSSYFDSEDTLNNVAANRGQVINALQNQQYQNAK